MTFDEYKAFLTDMDPRISLVKDLGGGVCAYTQPLMFHWSIRVCMIGDRDGYFDHWCLPNQSEAEKALTAWDGTGDLTGRWQRHPSTMRRRLYDEEGNVTKEWVAQ